MSFTDVTIGFEEDMYAVSEGAGTVSLCVVVRQGELQDTIFVGILFVDGTAVGKIYTACFTSDVRDCHQMPKYPKLSQVAIVLPIVLLIT